MKERMLTKKRMGDFEEYLQREEKSRNTVLKYLRDVYAFAAFTDGVKVTKQATIAYKEHLLDAGYAIRSVNSMLASINCLFTFLCWEDCKVKTVKLQRQLFCSEEKQLTRAEYLRLCRTAKAQHRERLTLILQTICGTGIRVSELPYITVDAVQTGKTVVSLKGKTRTIFIVRKLQQKLLRYISEQKIQSGSVFITRSGKPLSRTNIWREMKTLCAEAGVDAKKVFPHNLRHLFARTFYNMEKDVVKLADILGHSSVDTTRIYTISTGTEHRRCMENLRLIL